VGLIFAGIGKGIAVIADGLFSVVSLFMIATLSSSDPVAPHARAKLARGSSASKCRA
jgi:hypothetical protein